MCAEDQGIYLDALTQAQVMYDGMKADVTNELVCAQAWTVLSSLQQFEKQLEAYGTTHPATGYQTRSAQAAQHDLANLKEYLAPCPVLHEACGRIILWSPDDSATAAVKRFQNAWGVEWGLQQASLVAEEDWTPFG